MTQPNSHFAACATALLVHYSFELPNDKAEELVSGWLRQYPANWVLLAVIEALYQGRYKSVSVDFDREVKMLTYAEEGMAEAWLVDLNAETLEVYRQPNPSGYQSKQQFNRGQAVAVPGFPDVRFSIEQLLG